MEERIYTGDWLLYEDTMKSSNSLVAIRGRRSGNTTRVIDNAIQLLFEGKKVAIKNNPDTKRIDDAKELKDKVLRRLKSEHPHIVPFVKTEIIRHLLFMYIERDE